MKKRKTIHYLLLILFISAIILIIDIIKVNFYKFEVHGFGRVVEPVYVNLSLNDDISNKPSVCFDCYCKQFNSVSKDVFFVSFDKNNNEYEKNKIKTISLLYDDSEFLNKTDNLQVFVGYKYYFFNEKQIKDLKTQKVNINSKDYNLIKLPVKNNYRGDFNAIVIIFLSLFYNYNLFLIPYLYLFLAFGILLFFNYEKVNDFIENYTFKNNTTIFFSILLLGFLIRINQFLYYPLWKDEAYTKGVALRNFISLFQDPGNPPLFFMLEKITTLMMGNSLFALRLPSLIYGILLIYLTYLLFKKYDKTGKISLYTVLLISLDSVAIYQSQDCKYVALCMLICACCTYFLFKYLNKSNIKNLCLYSFFAFCAINTHYYLFFYAFGNFIYIILNFIKNKKYKNLKSFFIVNSILFLTFTPYFFIVRNIALGTKFNTWIMPMSLSKLMGTFTAYFGNTKIFAIFVIYIFIQLLIYKLAEKNILKPDLSVNEDKKNMLIYIIYSISFIFCCVVLISLFIKPIYSRRIFLSIYYLIFLLKINAIYTMFNFKIKDKIHLIFMYLYLILALVFYFSTTKVFNIRESYSFDNFFMQYVQNDVKTIPDKYKIIAIIDDHIEYLNAFPEIKKIKNIDWQIVDSNIYNQEFNIIKYIDKDLPTIIYISNISLENDINIKDMRFKVFKTKNHNFAKVIYK